jgi:hypothetical protein
MMGRFMATLDVKLDPSWAAQALGQVCEANRRGAMTA